MSMVGKLNFFLRFQILLCETGIFLLQGKYARNIIKKFKLGQAKAKRTPVATHVKVSKDNVAKKVDKSMYRNIIGSLLYLTAS